MVTETQPTAMEIRVADVAKARQHEADLQVQAKVAMESGDMDKVLEIGGEYQKAKRVTITAQNAIKTTEIEASKGERDELGANITKLVAAQKAQITRALSNASITAIMTRSSDESGFDEMHLAATIDADSSLMDLFHEILVTVGAVDVKSAKRVRIVGSEVIIDPVVTKGGGNTTGNGGSAGKGYVKDGVKQQLQEAFDNVATAAEKTELAGLNGDSNKTFALKKRVVLAAGYVQSS